MREFRLFGILIFFLLPACGLESVSTPERATELETYDLGEAYLRNSCASRFSDGEEITVRLAPLRSELTHFSKAFDSSRLHSIGRASAAAIHRWMKEDGVHAYAMPIKLAEACTPLGPLPSATNSMRSYWEAVGGPGTLAIYLPLNRSKPLGATTPVILLRSDTDRYSLIHEYMHHVFNQLREAQGQRDEDLLARLETKSQRYDQVAPLPLSEEGNLLEVQKYLNAWIDFSEVLLEAMVIFPLEEVTIEALMQEAANENILAPITTYNRVNSVAYIRRSYDDGALETLNNIQGLGFSNRKLAERHNLGTAIQRIEALSKQAESLISEGAELRARYAASSFGFQISQKILAPEPQVHPPGCAHEKIWEKYKNRF